MRGSVILSSAVHVIVLIAVYFTRPASNFVVPGPDVVQVSLLDPNAAETPAPPTPPPPPQPTPPAKEQIQPEEAKGVKLEPAKPQKPQPKPQQTPPPPSTQRAPVLASAPVGPAGLRGDVGVDASDFEFTYYLVLVRNKIAGNWVPPAGLATGGNPVRAVVYFRVGRGGEISGLRIETPSGQELFDGSSLRAVTLSDPLPPLPLGFPGGDLGIHFGFEWESP
jgi:outer membrane biosynthesis protein TonB